MIRKRGDLFRNLCADVVIYNAIKKDVYEFQKQLKEKYKKKLKDISQIQAGQVGFKKFEINNLVWKYIKEDPELKKIAVSLVEERKVTQRMVKQVFKDCFNEILDDVPVIDDGKVKTNRMLLAEKVFKGVMDGTLDPVTLKGFEVIRDTIGEKPANEIISKGMQQKVIDVHITQEKVEKVKNILEGLRKARLTDGFEQNITVGTGDARPGDERVVEADVSGESERIYNVDVLPDKQD